MNCVAPWTSTSTLSARPPLSLAHVRWIRETEETDDDGDTCTSCVQMFDAVGEQHRLPNIEAAREAIAKEGAFVPPVFWLVPDDCNEHDSNAVAVHSVVKSCAVHVGFLPRTAAIHFRESMTAVGRPGEVLEVCGCITNSKSSDHPNVRLNLPWLFANLMFAGFIDDPANSPGWLRDSAPVLKRPYSGPRAAAFSEAELCKIYCWFGHQQGWFLLPDAVESEVLGFRGSGLGSLHKVIKLFEESVEDAEVAGREWATYNHNSEAKAFARASIRDHLGEELSEEDVKAELKGTSVRGQLKDKNVGKQIYEIEWVRLGSSPELLCRMTLQKVSDSPDGYEIREMEFSNQ